MIDWSSDRMTIGENEGYLRALERVQYSIRGLFSPARAWNPKVNNVQLNWTIERTGFQL